MQISRPQFLVLGLALAGCAPPARDTVHPAICHRDPEELPRLDAAGLAAAVHRASHVLRGRVRFTGDAVNRDGRREQRYRYIIVDALEFLKGDPWQVPGRYRKSFPILVLEEGQSESQHFNPRPTDKALAAALACREGEALWFVLDLPDPQRRPLHEMPDPVRRSFGPLDVRVHAVAQKSQRDQLLSAVSR